jgi:hypothetical protein
MASGLPMSRKASVSWYTCVCVYIYICIYWRCIHIYICIDWRWVYMYTYIHMYILAVYIYIYTYVHKASAQICSDLWNCLDFFFVIRYDWSELNKLGRIRYFGMFFFVLFWGCRFQEEPDVLVRVLLLACHSFVNMCVCVYTYICIFSLGHTHTQCATPPPPSHTQRHTHRQTDTQNTHKTNS